MGARPRFAKRTLPMGKVTRGGLWEANIFFDDIDRYDFLKTLAAACLKTCWQVHAYCWMSNHFHLVLETPEANLVEGMRWLLRPRCAARSSMIRPRNPTSSTNKEKSDLMDI